MPTLVVETNVNTQLFQRRFAKNVSLWLHKQGAPINHVITKYHSLEVSQVFSGPYAFDKFPCLAGSKLNFAFVTCYISQDRPAQFHKEMAAVIVEAMQPEILPEYIFINFKPVDPNHYVNGNTIKAIEPQEVLQR
jgi:hypothetical protein